MSPPILTSEQITLANELLVAGELTNADIASRLGISRSLFYKLMPHLRTMVTGRRKSLPDWHRNAADLLVQGATAAHVARVLCVNKSRVYYHLPRQVRDQLQKQGRQHS